jgi:hypothetical protein
MHRSLASAWSFTIRSAFYAGYGDGPPRGEGPYQAMAAARGNPYFDEEFPALSRILSVTATPGG